MSEGHPTTELPLGIVSRVLEAVRARRPLVHCLTNDVTIGRVADALAALGTLPVMAGAAEEAADMVAHAQALVLNLGTPSAARWAAARTTGERAAQLGVPIIVDPVGCGATPWRTEQSRALVAAFPASLIRGNVPEMAALAEIALPEGVVLRGVTAQDDATPSESVVEAGRLADLARRAAQSLNTTVVLTGRQNVIADGRRVLHHSTGAPLLERVVGGGDVLTAVLAACRAVEQDAMAAAFAGLTFFSLAAQSAGAAAGGPGSFWPRMLDNLGALTPELVESAPDPRPPAGGDS